MSIVIERGIPIPKKHNSTSRWSGLVNEMCESDSVHLPYDDALKLVTYMRNNNIRPVLRATTPRGTNYGDAMARVWHNGELTEEEKQTKKESSNKRVKKMRARIIDAKSINNGRRI